MGWLTALQGKVVGLDTTPLIYLIEEHPVYLERVRSFFNSMDRGEFTVVTSTVTLLEVLVHPFRRRDLKLAEQYRNILLSSRGLATVPMSPDIAEEAARLRATHNIRTADAIQVATALHERASHLLTNDVRLRPLTELQVLILDELEA
jgi:predicted nucleic acid-binding protein